MAAVRLIALCWRCARRALGRVPSVVDGGGGGGSGSGSSKRCEDRRAEADVGRRRERQRQQLPCKNAVRRPPFGHHNTGKNCFDNCHNHGFTLAGTLYTNATGNTGFAGASITVTDSTTRRSTSS